MSQHADWLSTKINWLEHETPCINPTPEASTSFTLPCKDFTHLSERQKRRRVEEIKSLPSDHITFVASQNLKGSDARYVYDFIQNYPQHASAIKAFCESLLSGEQKTISKEDALKVYVNADLTKHSYEEVRSTANEIVPFLFPSYYQIQQAKEECYPTKETITVSEVHAKINLQSLLDKTVDRLMQAIDLDRSKKQDLTLVAKWGCDGASGQPRYKTSFSNVNFDDSSIFTCSLVPLKLYEETSNTVVWINPAPSSSRYCRPISFRFEKENTTLTRKSIDDIN